MGVDVDIPWGTPILVWMFEATLPETCLEDLNARLAARAVSALDAMRPPPGEEITLVEVEALVAEDSFVFPEALNAATLDIAAVC